MSDSIVDGDVVASTATTNELIERIQRNIARRKKEIADDDIAVQVVENTVLSQDMASIKGIQHSLNTMRLARVKKDQEPAKDPHSHNTYTVGDIRRR